ncbi:MAG: rhomboid family intramembrane serine protease [Deltaproteobacteria bacterium]|nr:rhomboid family intramembrane serine protease [Deltaproteobacteria bacterium]
MPEEIKKAIICPNCKKLISSYNQTCPHCGIKKPERTHNIIRVFGGSRLNFVKIIITANIVLFTLCYLLPFILPEHQVPANKGLLGILPSPSVVSLHLLGWADPHQILNGSWWLLITAIFLHGGVLHILFNMMWFKDLGPTTQELFSPHKMVIIYLISGVMGNLLAVLNPSIMGLFSILIRPAPIIGASGAVFGLIGAIIAFGKKSGGLYGRHLVRQLGLWAIILIVMGFIIPGISNAAHIGGFITGFVIGYLLPVRASQSSELKFVIIAVILYLIIGYAYFRVIINLIRVILKLH